MQYRNDKYGNKISVLGYGCMRFTKTAGVIDMDKAEKELMAAYEMGVNYYDTAYIYGGSEAAIGKIAGDQILKLQTLGLTAEEAEERILAGLLK